MFPIVKDYEYLKYQKFGVDDNISKLDDMNHIGEYMIEYPIVMTHTDGTGATTSTEILRTEFDRDYDRLLRIEKLKEIDRLERIEKSTDAPMVFKNGLFTNGIKTYNPTTKDERFNNPKLWASSSWKTICAITHDKKK